MTLRLAPYNDAMRLGQGFNSYTHELCIDQAVRLKQHRTQERKADTSQVVSYSARFVEKLSDIVESMNVSYSSAIKKGTIEISGNSSTVDETTFKSSHLNAVVAVKVVNQTISSEDECEFQALENDAGATYSRFNEIYGDSYISGFIEGGDFTGIVSIKVMEGKDIKGTVDSIKSSLNMNSKSEVEEFVLGPRDSSARSSLASAIKDTETTISISWIGGAQIKDPSRAWDIDSMYEAAAAFPAAVAQCPQRTWAILTPYKANRSFVKWSTGSPVKMLEYDLIGSYTAELFDSYMDYKLLLKQIQNIISDRKNYRQRIGVVDAIDTNLRTLLSVRGAMRDEQTKIVEAIGVLSRDPSVLKRQGAWSTTNRAPLVKKIIESALGNAASWEPKDLTAQSTVSLSSSQTTTTKVVSTEVNVPASTFDAEPTQKANSDDGILVVAEKTLSGASNSTPVTGTISEIQSPVSHPVSGQKKSDFEFNFDTLMPPEVWEDLLPEYVEPVTYDPATPSKLVPPQSSTSRGPLNQFMPPLDNSAGPGVVVSQSYDTMQRELEEFRKVKLAAEKAAADAEASRMAKEREYAALNAQFAQYKLDTERAQGSLASNLSNQTSTIQSLEAEIQRHKAAESQAATERDEARNTLKSTVEQKDNEIWNLREAALDGLTPKAVTVLSVTYGTKVFYQLGEPDHIGAAKSLERLIVEGGSFLCNDPWFLTDPDPGLQKQCVVTWRVNMPGWHKKIRVLICKQHSMFNFVPLRDWP